MNLDALRVALAGCLLIGCTPAAFSVHARDNDPGDLERALGHMHAPASGPQNASGRALAFLVTAPDRQLVGYDLDQGRVLWQKPADVRSRVAIGRGVVAYRQGERALVVRDAESGAVRATIALAPNEAFVGLTLDPSDADRCYYVVQTLEESAHHGAVVAVDLGGRVLWRRRADGELGGPQARGGVVAVPFAHQDLVLLDGTDGGELARVRATEEEIAFARALPEGLFYGGGQGVFRLDRRSASGTRAGSSFAAAKLHDEQLRAAYFADAYEATQVDYGAYDRNRLLWRGSAEAVGAGFADNQVVLQCYRFFFALDAGSGRVRWAYAHPRSDAVSSEHTGRAILFASADGELGVIDARSGALVREAKTGLRLAGASFDADGLTSSTPSPPPALEAVLADIVWDHDARLPAVKLFAASALGEVPGVAAAAALIKMVRSAGLPPAVVKRAGEALLAHRERATLPLLLEALAEHYDYLEDRRPRSVEVLATAAAALALAAPQTAPGATPPKETIGETIGTDTTPEVSPDAPAGAGRAVAPAASAVSTALAAHLADPQTPATALPQLTAALATLAPGGAPGANEARAALREFLLAYHADPLFLADPSPLTNAAEALRRGGAAADPADLRVVAQVAEDKRTLPPVQRALR
jgi:outer membrane protein assembly factor BamB